MQDTTHPAELVETLTRMGLGDLLEGFIDPTRVRRWGFLSVERFAATHGYVFERRDNNVYGALWLVPASATLAPKMRIITRSDVAAVHGSRRAA